MDERLTRLEPLFRAAIQSGNLALVSIYLKSGREVNARDQRGRTPLMLAAIRGHAELCRLLLENGATSSAKDDEGRTAIDLATQVGMQGIVSLIKSFSHSFDKGAQFEGTEESGAELFDAWSPEVEASPPIEDISVRSHVLESQDFIQAGPPIDLDSDWSDFEIDLPNIDEIEAGRELWRDDVQKLFAALIGEARLRGAFRPSLVEAVAREIDGSGDGDAFRQVLQVLNDLGCIPEEDEEEWGRGFPLSEEWKGDSITRDCLGYLCDLRSLNNDPYQHLRKDVKRSILLDREGEERVGRLIFLAIKDACAAIASDERVPSIILDIERRIQETPFLSGRLTRIEEGTEESDETTGDEEEEPAGDLRPPSTFRMRLAEVTHAYREQEESKFQKSILEAVESLELTPFGFRFIQSRLAASGWRNEQLDVAIERASRLEGAMFLANVRLAISVSEKYRWSKVPTMDRIQEAFIGLMKAIERFDFERGNKFSTYATWWLRQSVTRAISDKERVIRVPVHMMERISKLGKVARALGLETPRDITPAQLSAGSDLSEAEVSKALSVVDDAVLWEDSPELSAEVMSQIAHEEGPFGFAERLEMERIVLECVDRLPARDADVIKHRYGLVSSGEMTLEEVGKLFDLTRERIRQIESKALEKLRNPSNGIAVLQDYVSEHG